ncbi:hypothetical protein FB561_2701 [Kribbella amoyensis]|uniref:Neutral zinc metallopeptidase n=2 Tax=Kribbella amoyensis TaxID=996641 RepID=A0A561BRS3_9ACTN|nr:hypothetical protein FB561_2701 [Kribbella amoyensis]
MGPQPWQPQPGQPGYSQFAQPMQQLPHGLGWGAPPPGGPHGPHGPRGPKKKSKAPLILIPLVLVGLGILGVTVAQGIAKGNDPEYTAPTYTPTSRTTSSPTEDPTNEPSPTAPPTTRPTTTRPTVTKPTAPRTTNPPVKRGPTDYEMVSRNKVYRVGTMASVGCKESRARQSNTAGARANYVNLKTCLGKSWPRLIQASGAQFRAPTVLMFTGTVTSPCGSMNDTGPPFYCGSNETIYMNLREDIGNYNRYPQAYQKVWARMWMLHQFAHEYGHHVQNLTGILDANHNMRYEAPTRAAELEMTRRLELQASCFADVFIGANRRTYPITGQAQFQWRWLIGHVTDNNNDHGDANNHEYWALRGYQTRNPGACNTFTAPSARVR